MKTDFCELLFKSAALDLTDTGCRLVLQFHWGFLFLSGWIGLDSNTGWDRDEESCYNLSHFLKMFFKVVTMWQKIETAKNNPNEVSLCPKGKLTFQKFLQPCLYDKTPESPSTRVNADTVLPHALGAFFTPWARANALNELAAVFEDFQLPRGAAWTHLSSVDLPAKVYLSTTSDAAGPLLPPPSLEAPVCLSRGGYTAPPGMKSHRATKPEAGDHGPSAHLPLCRWQLVQGPQG